MIKTEDSIYNKEIFSLFHSEQELANTLDLVQTKLFPNNNMKDIFDKLDKFYYDFYPSPTIRKFLYCSYIWERKISRTPLTSSELDSTDSFHSLCKHMNELSSHPFCIIASYYTINYLINSNSFYQYSDYKCLKSISSNFYEIDQPSGNKSTPSEMLFYKASPNTSTQSNRTNSTRDIRSASQSIFFPLINCLHGQSSAPKPHAYYLNQFLPDISFMLATQSTQFIQEFFAFDLSSGYTDTNLRKKIRLLFESFFSIIDEVCQPNNILHNILAIYKLEYGFGVLSLISFINQLDPSLFLFTHNGSSEFTNNLLSLLLPLQADPDIFSPARNGLLSPIESYLLSNQDIAYIISTAKINLAMLYGLFDKNLSKLHTDLEYAIKNEYLKIVETPLPTELASGNSFPNNGWYMMHTMFKFIFTSTKAERDSIITHIETIISTLSTKQKQQIAEYLITRYNQDWFFKIEKNFSTFIFK